MKLLSYETQRGTIRWPNGCISRILSRTLKPASLKRLGTRVTAHVKADVNHSASLVV